MVTSSLCLALSCGSCRLRQNFFIQIKWLLLDYCIAVFVIKLVNVICKPPTSSRSSLLWMSWICLILSCLSMCTHRVIYSSVHNIFIAKDEIFYELEWRSIPLSSIYCATNFHFQCLDNMYKHTHVFVIIIIT